MTSEISAPAAGWARTAEEERACLAAEKAAAIAGVQARVAVPLGVSEWADQLGRCRDETAVEVEEPQKGLQLLDCRRARKIGDGLNPRWQGAYACGRKAVAKEIDRAAGK